MNLPQSTFFNLVLPLKLDVIVYGYASSFQENPIGKVVQVELRRKTYWACIVSYYEQTPSFKVQNIQSDLDEMPVVLSLPQIEFYNWMAQYYMCTLGEVYQAALPSIIKKNGTTSYQFKQKSTLCLSEQNLDFDQFKGVKQIQCVQLLKEKNFDQSTLIKEYKISKQTIDRLVEQDVIVQKTQIAPKFKLYKKTQELSELSEDQYKALSEIKKAFKKLSTCLFKGVTASGKTEVYLHLIDAYLAENKSVLFVVPEIGLSSQLVSRFTSVFGEKVGLYHSKLSDAQRYEIYLKQCSENPFKIIVATRSGIFLPHKNLGLIIIDEEHDYALKQATASPRYHLRDAAIYYAHQLNANVLLGSATPSIDSYYNAKTLDKFAYVELNKRYNDASYADIELIDLKEAHRKKQVSQDFSDRLLSEIDQSLNKGKKVILLQNRRGYNNYLQCDSCDHIQICERCDVSLTYHKNQKLYLCHYCGFKLKELRFCQSCSSTSLKHLGAGTQQIEEQLSNHFTDKVIQRLDVDATTKKGAHDRIIKDFEKGKIDILVGTQMVSKGLDFNNVGLVAIINADQSLFFPSFRTNERSFQLFVQLAGRASRRKGEQGKVLIQTFSAKHRVLDYVKQQNYQALYEAEIQERQEFDYPPISKRIKIIIGHQKIDKLTSGAQVLSSALKIELQDKVTGPQYALVSKVRNIFYMHINLKLSRSNYIAEKRFVQSCIQSFQKNYKDRFVFKIDVDAID